MKRLFAQRCYMVNVYGSWLLLAAVFVYVLWWSGPLAAIFVGAVGAAGLWLYVRAFPSISSVLGYGSVADVKGPARGTVARTVTLYTAVGCPFCPIVRHRLHALREALGFELEEIDVTLRPGLLVAKGIRAVPVVEVGGHTHVGNATTAELESFIAMEKAA
jgi:glutaredoxin